MIESSFLPTVSQKRPLTGESILLWGKETSYGHIEPTSLFLLRLILVPLVNLALGGQEESQDLR